MNTSRRGFLAALVAFVAGVFGWVRQPETFHVDIGKEGNLDRPLPLVRFRLTENLFEGGTARAVSVDFDGNSYRPNRPITVHDWGVNSFGLAGANGWAVKRDEQTDDHDIVWMERPVLFMSHQTDAEDWDFDAEPPA